MLILLSFLAFSNAHARCLDELQPEIDFARLDKPAVFVTADEQVSLRRLSSEKAEVGVLRLFDGPGAKPDTFFVTYCQSTIMLKRPLCLWREGLTWHGYALAGRGCWRRQFGPNWINDERRNAREFFEEKKRQWSASGRFDPSDLSSEESDTGRLLVDQLGGPGGYLRLSYEPRLRCELPEDGTYPRDCHYQHVPAEPAQVYLPH